MIWLQVFCFCHRLKTVINTLTFIDNFSITIITQIFEFHRFLQIKLKNIVEFNNDIKQIIVVIVASHSVFTFSIFNFRSTISNRVIFVDFVDFFVKWNTNINRFRRVFQKFRKHIVFYKNSTIFRNFIEIRQSSFNSSFSNFFDEHQLTQTNVSKRFQFYNVLNFENILTFNFSSFSNRNQKNHNRSFSSTRKQSITNISRHVTINSKIKTNTSRRFNNIFEITTKKIIYNRFIDSTFDFSNILQQQSFDVYIQRFLNAIVIKTIKIYIQRNSFQQKSSNSSNSQNSQNFQKNDYINIENDENYNNSRWNVDDFDFFDSMYENKFVHIDDFIIQIEKIFIFETCITFYVEQMTSLNSKKNENCSSKFMNLFQKHSIEMMNQRINRQRTINDHFHFRF